jgi:hypothetical protein
MPHFSATSARVKVKLTPLSPLFKERGNRAKRGGVSSTIETFLCMFVLCFFVSSCRQNVESPVMDYADFKTARLPDWECHQTFAQGHDSSTARSFLEVTAFPKKAYPGITMPWLAGNWRRYQTLLITARTRGSASRFVLSVWDGKGKYAIENRFEKRFAVDTVWTTCELPLPEGLMTPDNRHLNLDHITQVVFFTHGSDDPTIFDVKRIELR